MDQKRMKAMLAYLPCRAAKIPTNLRQLRDAESEGLAVCGNDYTWTLTPKGAAFVDGSLKAPKARRLA